ncbi:MAG TPA: hydrogenase expression/formation protein HypE [Candidatus Binatia bacterium]|nr:hydrogenase expression/formation protein HypE [Candidatus Binatia bacterium]
MTKDEGDFDPEGMICPAPLLDHKHIILGHGSGGKLTGDLVRKLFVPAFTNECLDRLDDQAVFNLQGTRVAFTTDAFVVTPLIFPGGDIGRLAINGTVNDLAMSGAKPLYIAAAFILEEGLELEELSRIVASMRQAAHEADVQLVTGDTKVVDRGKGDKLFITTTGLGILEEPIALSANQGQPGDKVILSGTIGDHGTAILSRREHLEFEGTIESDTAALHTLVAAMLRATDQIHCMRDPTRGGLATTLNELAAASGVGFEIDEKTIPATESVRGACEILGLDPLYVANEGKLVALVAAEAAENLVGRMRQHPLGAQAAIIGEAVAQHPGIVILRTEIGGARVIDVLRGEQLPRIC